MKDNDNDAYKYWTIVVRNVKLLSRPIKLFFALLN